MQLSAPPDLSPSKLVQYIKGRSSRHLQDEFPDLRKRYWGQPLWARGMSRRSASTLRTRSGTRTTKGSRSPRQRSLEPALSREALQAALAAPRFQLQLNPTALRRWLFESSVRPGVEHCSDLIQSCSVMLQLPELREFAARYTAAWCSGNPVSVAAFFSADGSLSVNDDPPAVGRAAIAAVAQTFLGAFPDLWLVMDEVLVRGDVAEYHWTLTGTNTGPEGTGRSVCISGLERWRMGSDGLIAVSQGAFDLVEYCRQLESGVSR